MSFEYQSMTSETMLKKLFDLACQGFAYTESNGKRYFTSMPIGFERDIAVYQDGHTLIFDNYDHPVNEEDTVIPFADLSDDPNIIVKKWCQLVAERQLDEENRVAAKRNYDLSHSDIIAWD